MILQNVCKFKKYSTIHKMFTDWKYGCEFKQCTQSLKYYDFFKKSTQYKRKEKTKNRKQIENKNPQENKKIVKTQGNENNNKKLVGNNKNKNRMEPSSNRLTRNASEYFGA